MNRKSLPLSVRVTRGVFTVSIGVETLAWAFERCQDCQPLNDSAGENEAEFEQKYLITDPDGFARDVKRSFLKEKEDGNTPLYEFFDRMCLDAVDDGSQFIIEPSGMAADDRDFDERASEWREGNGNANRRHH
jgi:hypothetical protein